MKDIDPLIPPPTGSSYIMERGTSNGGRHQVISIHLNHSNGNQYAITVCYIRLDLSYAIDFHQKILDKANRNKLSPVDVCYEIKHIVDTSDNKYDCKYHQPI